MTELQKVVAAKIGVITVTYNSTPVLDEFFESLAAQTHKNFVLYVVDNASSDTTRAITKARTDLPIVLIANPTNVGVAEGNNQGIRAALKDECECVLLLNNDTVFPPDLIATLYKSLETYRCEMTTPKIYYHDRPNVIWCAGGRFHMIIGYHTEHDGVGTTDVGQFDTAKRVDYSPTCCVLVRRTVFDRVGMMDREYFVYSDDSDFLYRCLKAGQKLWYVPQTKLWHKVSSLTGPESDFSIRYSTRNHIYFLRKHLPPALAFFRYWQSQARSAAALVTGKITLSAWRLRREAARDGWALGEFHRAKETTR